MMYPKARIEKLLHFLVSRLPNVPAEEFPLRVITTTEVFEIPFQVCSLLQGECRLDGFLPRVNEDHDLVSSSDDFEDLFKNCFIEVLLGEGGARFTMDTEKVLLERNGTEGGIEVEKPGVG
jgi:hypothetical protein